LLLLNDDCYLCADDQIHPEKDSDSDTDILFFLHMTRHMIVAFVFFGILPVEKNGDGDSSASPRFISKLVQFYSIRKHFGKNYI
jgi:hypothetical protein